MPRYGASDKAILGAGVTIGPRVTVADGAVIGRNVTLEADVAIGRNAVIGDNVIIGYRDGHPLESLSLQQRLVRIGEGAKIRSGAIIYWGVSVGYWSHIGHNAVVREMSSIGSNAYVGNLTAVEGNTVIGSHVGIHTQCHITAHCHIGDYTFIGPMVVSSNDRRMRHRRSGHGQSLLGFTAEKYVRIGAGVTILPGVRFGEGCIVGAGSVVTGNVPAYKVALGVPARTVRDAPIDDNPTEKDAGA